MSCSPIGTLILLLPEQGVGSIGVSQACTEAAYTVRIGTQWCVVRGSERGPRFDAVSRPVFASSSRLVYLARQGKDWHVEIWGEHPWPRFRIADDSDPSRFPIVTSKDGKSIAVAVSEPQGVLLLIDGRRAGRFAHLQDLQWCESARQFMAIVLNDDGFGIFKNGNVEHVQLNLDYVELRQTSRGDPYVRASDGNNSFFGPPNRLVKFPYLFVDVWAISPDGSNLALVTETSDGNQVLVVNGNERMNFKGHARFVYVRPTNQSDYAIALIEPDGRHFVVTGEKKIGPFHEILSLSFCPEGLEVCSHIGSPSGECLVIGNRSTALFDRILCFRFSPDGKDLSLCVQKGREIWHYQLAMRSLGVSSSKK